MELILTEGDLRVIQDHAERCYPEECCGFLIGAQQDSAIAVVVVQAATNAREDRRHDRFVIPPEAVLAAHRDAERQGLDVVGYYHSHPDHPPDPSEFDREHAWPGLSYLIVAVRDGVAAEARSWRLRADRTGFEPQPLRSPASDPQEMHG
jgi:proteasome lid subunit RPN8/RPN11